MKRIHSKAKPGYWGVSKHFLCSQAVGYFRPTLSLFYLVFSMPGNKIRSFRLQKLPYSLLPPYKSWNLKAIYSILAVVLLLPALLINLDELTFIDDEAIRALVALEMKFSGNMITPTIHGEYYYNKPPLFNWILLFFFETIGTTNEFTARLPTVLALIGFGSTVFVFSRKYFSFEASFLNAFLLITCGRILFWDSMLALIDITFSWVIFVLFMSIFHFFQKGRFTTLFVVSYLLTATGFLLKGLPSIVFQGTTLLIYFWYRRKIYQLFTLRHLLGILLFLCVVGSYYAIYNEYNSLNNVLPTLWNESSKRTIVQYGALESILHFFSFPFEMVYHFLPWSLLVLYFFYPKSLTWTKSNQFVLFCNITFIANIIIYWTSPEVYPRYLLMLAPLIFIAFIFLHERHKAAESWQYRTLKYVFQGVMVVITIASLLPLFLTRTQEVPMLIPKTLVIFLGCALLTYCYFRTAQHHLTLVVLFLLVFRIGFDWFVLPDRNANDFGDLCRQTSRSVGQAFKNEPLYIYKDTEMQPTNSFYMTNQRGQIINRKNDGFTAEDLLVIDPNKYPDLSYEVIAEMKVRHGKQTYHIGKIKTNK